MKYRISLDLSFADKRAADLLMGYARNNSGIAVSINEGGVNEEISFIDYHLCGHDENKPCENLERIEIRNIKKEEL